MPLTTGVPITNTYAQGTIITKAQLDATKTSVANALTKTGKTFTWTTWSGTLVGSALTTAVMNELKTAANTAADAYTTTCSHNTVNSHNVVNSGN